MKIGIDARLVPYEKKEGMAFYAMHLVENLPRVDNINEYLFFYNIFLQGDKRFIPDFSGCKNALNKIFWIPGRVLDTFWTRFNFPSIESFLGRVDLFHTLAFTSLPPYFYLPPQNKGKRVVTIHDIFPLLFPDRAKDTFNIKECAQGLRNVVKKADAIICVSKSEQRDLIEFTGIPENKTYAAYLGLSEDFCKINDQEKIRAVVDKYRIKGGYILTVSHLDHKKNLVNLIKAFALFRKEYNFKLVITGNKGDATSEVFETIVKLGLSEEIIYLGYVEREDVVILLNAAELFVFPSFYESFGFPNLEAMKCETPVVTSNIAAMQELVGDAGMLADPHSPESIAEAMTKVVSDKNLRDVLISRGKEKVKAFSWEKTARDTVEIYRKVLGS
ncbi:MAG: glycosyltransferase family 4 protein [Candidatus Omnitrophica bacterium]|nr:glycosyltransferase family 4 protein [Candidatus Omnitrophota bacterium]